MRALCQFEINKNFPLNLSTSGFESVTLWAPVSDNKKFILMDFVTLSIFCPLNVQKQI